MKTKRIPAARLELVSDKNGYIVWEPRKVPLMRDTIGITKRSELARRAMAAPINHSPRLPAPAMSDFDDLAAMPRWAKWIYVGSGLVILAGIGVMVWASV